MRSKLGILCMLLGAALMCGAGALYWHNRSVETEAAAGAGLALPQVIEQIPEEPDRQTLLEQMVPVEFLEPEDLAMTEVVIDGEAYIGYLTIPALELELPVISQWSDARLRKAPCRYYGNLRTDDLVIMAHNYRGFFRELSQLKLDDVVFFTDMEGIVTAYTVVGRDVVAPSAVEEVTAGAFDLTLFTCTYDSRDRVVVYCDRAEVPATP